MHERADRDFTDVIRSAARPGDARSRRPHRIAGGWGIDALLGRQTTAHRDIDLGVDGCDIDRAVRALL
ncbi:MAG: nucleotidyltransferase domain-containing protein, partial [Chloroflexota bacterium]